MSRTSQSKQAATVIAEFFEKLDIFADGISPEEWGVFIIVPRSHARDARDAIMELGDDIPAFELGQINEEEVSSLSVAWK